VSEYPSHDERTLTTIILEIRNRIYKKAFEGAEQVAVLVSPGNSAVDKNGLRHRPPHWDRSDRPLLGLTQTCRQIRIEVLPIYMRNLRVILASDDLYKYLDLFLFHGEPVVDIEKVETEITISNTNAHEGDETDIAPLLRLRRRSPGFVLELQDQWTWTTDETPAMMDIHTNDTWWAYFDVAITRILIQEKQEFFNIVILVKRAFQEAWMGKGYKQSYYGRHHMYYCQGKKDWMNKRGLTFVAMPVDVYVDYSYSTGDSSGHSVTRFAEHYASISKNL